MPIFGSRPSSEEWVDKHHWDCDEVEITVAGEPGQQNLGTAVPAGKKRRIRTLKIRHSGINNTVVTVLAGATVKFTIDVPPQTTRLYEEKEGIKFQGGEQPVVQSSDVTGGSTFVRASGIESG